MDYLIIPESDREGGGSPTDLAPRWYTDKNKSFMALESPYTEGYSSLHVYYTIQLPDRLRFSTRAPACVKLVSFCPMFFVCLP